MRDKILTAKLGLWI
jgi:hypothetical protein